MPAPAVAGESVAAVAVDLRLTTDTVYVASGNGTRLTDVVVEKIAAVVATYDRKIEVRDVAPNHAGDPGGRIAHILVGLYLVVGFAGAIAAMLLTGLVPEAWVQGARRVTVMAAVSVAFGLLVSRVAAACYGGHLVGVLLVCALATFATAMTTMTLESVAVCAGIGIATIVFIAFAAPVLAATSPLLLVAPMSDAITRMPHGAALDAITRIAYFDANATLTPVLILIAWPALSIFTLVVARLERERDGVALR